MKTESKIKAMKAADGLIQVIFASLIAGGILFVWWKYYQSPLLEYQKFQALQAQSQPTTADANGKAEGIVTQGDASVKNIPQNETINETINVVGDVLQTTAPTNIAPKVAPKKILIENKKVKVLLNLQGLKFDGLILKNYKQNANSKETQIELFNSNSKQTEGFVDFGFVAKSQSEVLSSGFDFPNQNSIWALASGEDLKMLQKLLPASETEAIEDVKNKIQIKKAEQILTENSVLLSWASKNANLKYFALINKPQQHSPYIFNIKLYVVNVSAGQVVCYNYVRFNKFANDLQIKGNAIVHEGLTAFVNNQIEEKSFKDLTASQIFNIDFNQKKVSGNQWLGFNEKYWFYGAFLTNETHQTQISNLRFLRESGKNSSFFQVDFSSPEKTISSGNFVSFGFNLYLGPKRLDELSAPFFRQYPLSDRIIDFGALYIIAKPVFIALELVNKITHNYGLAIILLTIFIKFLLYPLSSKSYQSMAKMKRLAPALQIIRDRNKGDNKKIQQEIAMLYRSEKINPVSGCLPLLLQMPVFFALYKILIISIDLRHAPFFGWINDLSSKDPSCIFNLFGLLPIEFPTLLQVGILPILMGLSMFVQQALTPKVESKFTAGAGSIIKWMPLFLTFIFASFPAGLLLYWITNNIISILQQLYFEKFVSQNISIFGYKNWQFLKYGFKK